MYVCVYLCACFEGMGQGINMHTSMIGALVALPSLPVACACMQEFDRFLTASCVSQAVAVGTTFVAVATSKRMLRLFSTSGIQLRVVMLQGPVLCMHGVLDQLAVLCHSPTSPGADGSQDVHFQWLNVDSKAMIASGPVCLSPAAKLEWLQLTDHGLLAMMDSAGIVSLYSPGGTAGHWTPVLDINSLEKDKKMHKRDWFWPVAITQDDIIGVLVKEEKRYPDAQMPVMSKFPLSMPLLAGCSTEEEAFVRKTLFTDHQATLVADEDDEAAVDAARVQLERTLLQQMNVACTQKKLARALDLAKMFSSEKGVIAATTLANRHKLSNLAERIDLYRQTRFREEEEEEIEYEEVEEVSYRQPAANKRRREEVEEVEEEQDSRQQDDDEDDHSGSPSAKSTADTPPVYSLLARTEYETLERFDVCQHCNVVYIKILQKFLTISDKQHTLQAPAPNVGQRRPGTAALFASTKPKPANAAAAPGTYCIQSNADLPGRHHSDYCTCVWAFCGVVTKNSEF